MKNYTYISIYFNKLNAQENQITTRQFSNHTNNSDYCKNIQVFDKVQLIKYLLVWIAGAIISLLPTFMYLYVNKYPIVSLSQIIIYFFKEPDVFLVITTLTISTLFEIVFSNKDSVAKYIVVSISIVLIIFSFYIFALLKHDQPVPFAEFTGILLTGICIIVCSLGYSIICFYTNKKETI